MDCDDMYRCSLWSFYVSVTVFLNYVTELWLVVRTYPVSDHGCWVVMLRLVYSELNRQICQERGFNSESLQCSSCADLPQFHLDELVADCNSCCRKDYVETKQKYPRAHIEICECNLGRFPQAEAFVKSNMVKKWGTCVKVRYVRGTLPTIKLLDAEGEVQKTMNIEKWDTDTITEFLNTWLEC